MILSFPQTIAATSLSDSSRLPLGMTLTQGRTELSLFLIVSMQTPKLEPTLSKELGFLRRGHPSSFIEPVELGL